MSKFQEYIKRIEESQVVPEYTRSGISQKTIPDRTDFPEPEGIQRTSEIPPSGAKADTMIREEIKKMVSEGKTYDDIVNYITTSTKGTGLGIHTIISMKNQAAQLLRRNSGVNI